ncbi:MAG: DUF1326 domain-containing protein [Pirellulales bacterium]
MFLKSAFCLALGLLLAAPVAAEEISGDYLETRTCDIYTGPCFANSEVGLSGREALMAWSIDQGQHDGVDLSGLRVVLAIRGAGTLGMGGGLVVNPDPIKAVILVDDRATPEQSDALVAFVRTHAARVTGDVTRVAAVPITFELDHIEHAGSLQAGNEVAIHTRALNAADHCCTNEVVFYPPLAAAENVVAAYTLESHFGGRGLGARWSKPNTRSAFLATFAY